MNRTRRYGRLLKRALIIYSIYLLVGMVLFGADLAALTLHPGATFGEYRPMVIQLLFLFFVIIIQFVGLFWFRGSSWARAWAGPGWASSMSCWWASTGSSSLVG